MPPLRPWLDAALTLHTHHFHPPTHSELFTAPDDQGHPMLIIDDGHHTLTTHTTPLGPEVVQVTQLDSGRVHLRPIDGPRDLTLTAFRPRRPYRPVIRQSLPPATTRRVLTAAQTVMDVRQQLAVVSATSLALGMLFTVLGALLDSHREPHATAVFITGPLLLLTSSVCCLLYTSPERLIDQAARELERP